MKLAVLFEDDEKNIELLNNYTLLVKKRLKIEHKLIKRFGHESEVITCKSLCANT